ncbi:MAG TPA: MMPL family transporter [Solirubrobacterales bacterium]|nr:MMPL family transporter [Solirubrobacterales bacterium]
MRISVRRPRLILILVASVAILAGFAGRDASEHLSNSESDFGSWDSESYQTAGELDAVKPKGWRGDPNIALLVDGEAAAFRLHTRLQGLPQVEATVPKLFASRDEDLFAVLGWLRTDLAEGPAAFAVAQALERPGVKVGGRGLLAHEVTEQAKSDLRRAELIAFPLLLMAGLWVFRSIIAALLPMLVGGLTLLIVTGCIRALAEVMALSLFALNLALAMALGLVVDYGLLIVSRFREELAAGRSPHEAAGVTLATAGRTVAISCLAISAAASSLLVFPISFVRSAAITGILVALVAGAISLLALPALLTLLGERVNALTPAAWQRSLDRTARPRSAGFWYRTGRFVMRRAVPVAVLSSLLLVLLALPALGMRFTGFDTTSLPPASSARAFAEEARENFPHPGLGEIGLAIHGNLATAKRVSKRVEHLTARTGFAIPSPTGFEHSPRLWQLDLNPTHAVLSRKTKGFVERLRAMDAPMTVTGDTAFYIDAARSLERRLPYAAAILVLVTLFFFGIATRSLVLPLKAVAMNILSLGATCGILVLIFQGGRLQEALNYDSQNALVLALPIVVSVGAFGLLTDYGLFLLMRIKEARDEGRPDPEAIALGLERTGRIITAAALLFCLAVGPFATSEVLLIKEGVMGVATAVLLDAFVVRPLLVPSLMAILGKWNWWPRKIPLRPRGADPVARLMPP